MGLLFLGRSRWRNVIEVFPYCKVGVPIYREQHLR